MTVIDESGDRTLQTTSGMPPPDPMNELLQPVGCQPTPYIFVQENKGFRRRDRREVVAEEGDAGRHAQQGTVSIALALQRSLQHIALLIQGFLAGFSIAQALFVIFFGVEDRFLLAYRLISRPIEAVFYVCFVFSLLSALDSVGDWRRGQARILGGLLYCLGLSCSVVLDVSDEQAIVGCTAWCLLDHQDVRQWLSTTRTVCALVAWVLVAPRDITTPALFGLGEEAVSFLEWSAP